MKQKAMTLLTIWMLLLSIVGMILMLGLLFYAFSLFGQFSSLQLSYEPSFEHSLWLQSMKRCFSYYDPVLFRQSPYLLDLALLKKTRFVQCVGDLPVHVRFETPTGIKEFATSTWQHDDVIYRVPIIYYNSTSFTRSLGTLLFGVTLPSS